MMPLRQRHGLPLGELIRGLGISLVRGDGETRVCDIVEDSRLATPGCLFVARPGLKSDGGSFIDDAVKAGAVAVLCQDERSVTSGGVTVLASRDVAGSTAY